MNENQQKQILDFFSQLRTKYLAYFPLLTIIMNPTSRFKLLYTAPNQATLALALVFGLGPLALWI